VQKLGAVSGASSGEVSAGMIQFGQALASGRLQGDELRSIMENFPALAKAIADNFETADGRIGVTIGTLRRMGSEGELTSGKIAEAALKASTKANEEFSKMPTTMQQSFTRLEDSWTLMLGELGRKFEASGFVQGVNNFTTGIITQVDEFLSGPTLNDKIAQLQAAQAAGRSGRYTGPSNISTGSMVFNPYAGNQWSSADDALLANMLAERAKIRREAYDQARTEGINARIAPTLAVESQTGEFAPLSEKRKIADNLTTRLDDAIKQLSDLASLADAAGNITKDYSLEDVNNMRARLEARRSGVSIDAANILSNLGKGQRGIDDMNLARQLGGGGGALGIIQQSIEQQRGDIRTGSAGPLGSYIDIGIQRAVDAALDGIDQMKRRTAETRASIAAIGRDAASVIGEEAQREAEAVRFDRFGTRDNAAIREWFEAYKKGLVESKQAALDAANANAAYTAGVDATLSRRLATGGTSRRAENALRLDFDLEQALQRMGPGENYDNYARSKRSQANDAEIAQFNQANRVLEDRLRMMREEEDLAGLSSVEYRVQSALLAKKLELEKEGLTVADEQYRTQLALTEQIERQIASQAGRGGSQRRVIEGIESGVDKLEGVFEDMWKASMRDGIEAADNIFLAGMTDIISQISAMMINEIAIKPVLELVKNMAIQFGADWIANTFGGGGPGSDFGAYGGTLPEFQPGYYAKGGTFTNSIVSTRTPFRFARGGAMAMGEMGEVGPEAIMPLERGPDGKLGVANYGGGGGVAISIYDQRQGGQQVEVQEQGTGGDGRRQISVFIRDQMRGHIQSGALDADMRSTYGSARQLSRK
jgi:tape measure domain-containing protein